ncbi:MAG: hypothetical protein CMF62_04000 [Magnetococcales bacterium]|nr:hypothetical protein [Magnetococcales bacterium]|tara:strand:+ start:390 stop:1373 length:984 start_codon:yes stop_codon:yes gene_type:complete
MENVESSINLEDDCIIKLSKDKKDEEMKNLLCNEFNLITPVFEKDNEGNIIKDNLGKNKIKEFRYLTTMNQSECGGKDKKIDCIHSMPILKKITSKNIEDKNALFSLEKVGRGEKPKGYIIRSITNSEENKTIDLTQQDLVFSEKTHLCFDYSLKENSKFSPVVLDDGSFIMRMESTQKNPAVISYVGECGFLKCRNLDNEFFTRLCPYNEEDFNGPSRKNVLRFYILLKENSCNKYKSKVDQCELRRKERLKEEEKEEKEAKKEAEKVLKELEKLDEDDVEKNNEIEGFSILPQRKQIKYSTCQNNKNSCNKKMVFIGASGETIRI